MSFRFVFSLSVMLLQLIAPQANAGTCPSSSFKEFVLCVTKAHPENTKHEISLSQSKSIVVAGSALNNPEIDFETTQGRSLGDKIGSNKVMVSYPFQFFGQRSAKIKKAEAEAQILKVQAERGHNNVMAQTVLNLYRLRQLKEEIAVLDETLTTYSKIINQYSARPRLSPEHEVSLSIFRLAIGDLSSKKTSLLSEVRKVEDFFSHVPDLKEIELEKAIPSKRKNWPKLASSSGSDAVKRGWPMLEVDAELKKAEAEFDVSRAEAWPEIKAGIIYEQEIEGALENSKYGFGITLPIPLLNMNQGNKQLAASNYQKSRIERILMEKEVQNERSRLEKLYLDSLDTMSKSPKDLEVSRKHTHMESLFARGLISSALMIEAHRQLFEFTSSQNEIEFKALEALYRIYELDGASLEELL